MTIVAFAACTKEAVPGGLNQTDKGKISVNVSALMGELTPDVGETKSSVESVVRLTWEDGDTVSAYCGSQYLGHLDVSTDEDNKLIAKLSGALTAPSGEGKVITLIHSNLTPVISGGEISVNLNSQKKESVVNPFVVYGTLESASENIQNQVVPFKFATSLINVTVAGLADACVDSVLISGINTVCKLTLRDSEEPEIAGAEIGTIAIDSLAQPSSSKDRAIFSVGIVKDETTSPSRKITAYQGTKRFGSAFINTEIAESTSYITVCNLKEADGSRGTIGSGDNVHSYVCIAGTKWATQNLAITDSGKKLWQSTSSADVNVPGTEESVINGDYFQWAASYQGYNVTENQKPDSLLIYTSFTNKCIGDTENKFYGLDSKKFNIANAPYGVTNYYTKYISDDGVKTLDYSDDAARVVWGSSWRMPTSAEFKAMREATYWAWNGTDRGYYVFMPGQGTVGLANYRGSFKSTSDDKTKALLFFPAAGCGYTTSNGSSTYPGSVGTYGHYWSSSLVPTNHGCTYYLNFSEDEVNKTDNTNRYSGKSVRPVSD